MAHPKFEVVDDDTTASPPSAGEREHGLAMAATLLAISTLSKRAIAEAKTWFTLLTMGGTWWLWYSIPDPSPTQIVSLSIFAVFILAANWLVRR